MKKLLFYASAVAVLFSSCSKDATEDIAIQTGNKVFTASINVEDDAQTRLSLNGTQYVWEVNDAIGVNSEKALDANILVSTSVCGSNPAFSVSNEDLERWLGTVDPNTAKDHNHLFVYFPYKSGAKVYDADATDAVKLVTDVTIPAVQRYAENSFYRNTVSALGFVEEYAGSEQDIELKVPTALLQIQVAGFGEAKSISMKIFEKGEADAVKLAGTAKVAVAPEYDSAKEEYKAYAPVITPANLTDAKDYVTVDFGKLPEELKYNGTLKINFIVPAGINLSEATLEFMLDYDGTSAWERGAFHKMGKANTLNENNTFVTKANVRTNIGTKETGFTTIKFNLDNKFLVENEEAFLAYAYLSRPGVAELAKTATDAFKADYNYAANIMGIEINSAADYKKVAAVEALIIADELDFASYGKEWADARIAAIEAEDYANDSNYFWHNVLTWYKENGYAIESLSYNAVHGSVMTTIKNLNVLGSGLTAGASLSNLTLENVTVNAGIATTTTSGTTTTTTYSKTVDAVALIAANNEMTSTAYDGVAKTMEIKNVVIGEGNKVNAVSGGDHVSKIGGVYAKVNTTTKNIIASKNIKGIALNIHSKTGYTPTVGRLYAYTGLYTTISLDLTDCAWDATQVSYPVIGEANSAIEAKGGVSTSMINAGVVGKVNTATYVYVDGVSYWNGGKIENDTNNKIYSAEELAWALDNSGADNIVLTNDIDMQCNATTKFVVNNIDHRSANKSSVSTPKAQGWTAQNPVYETYEIKNVKANIYAVTGEVAAFFGNADVRNVTFSNFTIDVPAMVKDVTAAAGIVAEGSVMDVTVDGLTLNVAKNAKIAVVGGVIANADYEDVVNVTANNIKVDSKADASAGIVAGVVKLHGVKSEFKGINVTGTNSVVAGTVKAMKKADGQVNTNYANTKKYAYTAAFGVANIDCAMYTDGHGLHEVVASDSSFGGIFAAGYWFKDAAKAAKEVTLSADALDIKNYNFVLNSNAVAGSYWNNIGFTIKK